MKEHLVVHDYRPPSLLFFKNPGIHAGKKAELLWMCVSEKKADRGKCAAGC